MACCKLAGERLQAHYNLAENTNDEKTLTVIALAFIGMALLPSCKKDYTCTCTIAGQKVVYNYKSMKKGDAKSSCDQQNTAAAILGGNCSLD